MKKNNVINMILNIAKFIFSDEEYIKLVNYLESSLFNKLRIFVEEKLEKLESKLILHNSDTVLEAQLAKCRRLDTLVTDLYVDHLVSPPIGG